MTITTLKTQTQTYSLESQVAFESLSAPKLLKKKIILHLINK